MPSSVTMAYSVLTDGLTRSSSICETRLGETPTRRASSRSPMPRRSRSSRRRWPTFEASRGPFEEAGSLADTDAELLRAPPGTGQERILEGQAVGDWRVGCLHAPCVLEVAEAVLDHGGQHLARPAAGHGPLLDHDDPVRLLHRRENRAEVERANRSQVDDLYRHAVPFEL